MTVLWTAALVVAATLLGYLGKRFRLPAGPMVGALVGTILFNLVTGRTLSFGNLKILLQILSGAMIGSQIGRRDLRALRQLALPTAFLLLCMAVMNVVFGGLIYAFSPLDAATALFATIPGGVADMAIISSDLGANTFYVAILQLFRVIIIMTGMPLTVKALLKRWRKAPLPGEETPTAEREPQRGLEPARLAVLLLTAAVGGVLFHGAGVLAGALIGAMLASGGYCVWRGKTCFPDGLKFWMQVFSGVYIGADIDRTRLMAIPDLLIPALIMLVGIYLCWFLTAVSMFRLFHIDPAVCLIGSVPGGIQEMALLSEDLRADTPKIAIMMTVRMMVVIMTFPLMNTFLVALLD